METPLSLQRRRLPFGVPVLVWRGEENRSDRQAL